MSKNKYQRKDYKRLYEIYHGIKKRCYNKNSNSYKDYGERGIIMCEEWRNSTDIFIEWALSHGYSDDLTIDRIDVNGNYEPSNCRWATYSQQMMNKRKTKFFEYNGERKSIMEWSEITGISFWVLYQRLVHLKWDTEKALTTPCRSENTIKSRLEANGITKGAYDKRRKMGWSLEDAINTPINVNKSSRLRNKS